MEADKKQGVGTLTYYSIETQDCLTLITSKVHAKRYNIPLRRYKYH
jgi:hypothetical protein